MNTRDEQRVLEALEALTKGLTVTERDTLRAHERLQPRLGASPRRRRLVMLSAVAAAVVVAAGCIAFLVGDGDDHAGLEPAKPPHGPADTLKSALQSDVYALSNDEFLAGRAPTRETLAGAWLLRPFYDPAPLLVDGDGDWSNYGVAKRGLGGTSTLTANAWTRRVAGGHDCGDDGLLPWQAALAADGSLRLQYAGDTNTCTPADDREVWDRLAPGSPIAEYLVAAAADVDWQTPESWSWEGTYIAPATGFLLEVDRSGHYWFYEDITVPEPVAADQGRLDPGAESGTIGATCSGGAFAGAFMTGETTGVEDYVSALPVVRITTSEDGCASSVAEQGIWVRMGLTG